MGYFFADRLNWVGVEIEGFNTTPHIKESSFSTSSHLRVTTLAFNAIARAKMMCDSDDGRRSDSPRASDRDARRDFCRLQPYVGAGLGLFFARASSAGLACPITLLPVSMPEEGCVITSHEEWPCLANTNTIG